MINEFLSPSLPPNNGILLFQQDGATAHTAVISIAALRRLFPQRVISRFSNVPWPPLLKSIFINIAKELNYSADFNIQQGGSRGNGCDLYFGDAWFTSRQRHRLSRKKFSGGRDTILI
jgi:hypothetical protein